MACKCQDAANNTFSCIRHISPNFNNIFCIFEDNKVLLYNNKLQSIIIKKKIIKIIFDLFFFFVALH